MMKKRKYILIIWLFFTGLLLSMTTYAWLSTNQIYEIESFDIHVATKGGLEISTDAINWKGVIGMLDLIEANRTYLNNNNQVPNTIKPLSSAGEIENGLLKMFYGIVDIDQYYYLFANRNIEKASLMSESDGKFVAFDIFIKVPVARQLYIAPGSGVSYKDDISEPSGIENAFRIAFINQGTVSVTTNTSMIQKLNNGNESIIWEVNYNTHTQNAINHAKNVYGITTIENNPERIPYFGIKASIPRSIKLNISKTNSEEYPDYFKLIEPNILTTKENNELKDFMIINPGVTKLRVYVWIEGQDIDCEDNASHGNLAINLQFIAK